MANMRRVAILCILSLAFLGSYTRSEPANVNRGYGDGKFPRGNMMGGVNVNAGGDQGRPVAMNQNRMQPRDPNAGGGNFNPNTNLKDVGLQAAAKVGQRLQNVASQIKNVPRKWTAVKIADHPSCAADVKSICSDNSRTNNFAILDCLQNDRKVGRDISETCQHFLWNYKKNLTTDIRFDAAASEVCNEDLERLADCNKLPRGEGKVISCLIENKANVSKSSCRQYLTKMASIVFGDYRLVKKLADECEIDIQNQGCGRLVGIGNDTQTHSQGKVVECLSEHVKKLADKCKHEILRIAELQADDYHMDRALFHACREDRERFCEKTAAGSGKVYKCLYRHKFSRDMSSDCREKLTIRQSLMQESYKVNKALAESCRRDVKKYGCLSGDVPQTRQGRMSQVLLCLEGKMRDREPVAPECIAEMRDMRKALLEDYKISPEVVTGCSDEISKSCRGLQRNGRTLHCLMDLARPERKKTEETMGDKCKRALEDLLEEADAGEDFELDPQLMKSCQPIVETACRKVDPGEGRIMSCLMNQIGTKVMTDECQESLLELQYFVSRDFKLDPRLYKNCRKDANNLCNAPKDWNNPEDTSPALGPQIFTCLYSKAKSSRKAGHQELSRACLFEVRRVMRQRAVSVELEPRIEEPCLQDLSFFCSENVEKGKEMECLQTHYEELAPDCKLAVGNFTEDEDEDVQMDRILMRACTPMIKHFCQDSLDKDEVDSGEVMSCLIRQKHNSDMDAKCAAGVEHHQILQLKDFRFSYKFKEACKSDVLHYCKGMRKKGEIIVCLSEIKRNDTLLGNKNRLKEQCRNQLSFESLNMEENIKLDPVLQRDCDEDIQDYCRDVQTGNAQVIECLRRHSKDLSEICKNRIFKRRQLEATDNRIDYFLITTCKRMIKTYCLEVKPEGLIHCLYKHKNDMDFDDKCRETVEQRKIAKSQDFRLNPAFQRSCQIDINKFCKKEMQQSDSVEYQGRIINCIKKKYTAHKLSGDCEAHVKEMIKEAALDYRQDPILVKNCKEEIHEMCLKDERVFDNTDDGRGQIEECLKEKFAKGLIKREECKMQVVRILSENKADIQVDPLLHRACALDLHKYCSQVMLGEGRQMSCLLSVVEDRKVGLQRECRKMLQDRITMWEYAAKVAPAESFEEIFDQIQASSSKNYFFSMILMVIGVIFLGGLCCGRVTKRVRQELKNK